MQLIMNIYHRYLVLCLNCGSFINWPNIQFPIYESIRTTNLDVCLEASLEVMQEDQEDLRFLVRTTKKESQRAVGVSMS